MQTLIQEKTGMIQLPVKDRNTVYELNPSKIIALGLNYLDHIKEGGAEVPPEPVIFNMMPNALTGHGENIIIPAFISEYDFPDARVDYEAELAFVIKDRCRNVPEADAFNHILGFTCFNDISQ